MVGGVDQLDISWWHQLVDVGGICWLLANLAVDLLLFMAVPKMTKSERADNFVSCIFGDLAVRKC